MTNRKILTVYRRILCKCVWVGLPCIYVHNKIQVVEGIPALYINGAPVLHTEVWFSYRGGGGGEAVMDLEEEEEEACTKPVN